MSDEGDLVDTEVGDDGIDITHQILEGVVLDALRLPALVGAPRVHGDAAVRIRQPLDLLIPDIPEVVKAMNEEQDLALALRHIVDIDAIVRDDVVVDLIEKVLGGRRGRGEKQSETGGEIADNETTHGFPPGFRVGVLRLCI